jgi:hypothetical protein
VCFGSTVLLIFKNRENNIVLTYERKLAVGEDEFTFKYKVITGEITGERNGNVFFKDFLWMPYKKFTINIEKDVYEVKALLFPINKMSFYKNNFAICCDLFPKLKRYTLIAFTLSTAKKVAIALALIFS